MLVIDGVHQEHSIWKLLFLGQPVINKTAKPNSQPVHSESCWTCFENTGQPAGVHLVWNYITISLIIVLIMIRWFRIYFIFLLLLLPTKPANVRYSGIWLKMDRQQKRDAWGNVSNLPSGDQGDRDVGNVWDMWYVKQLIRVIRKPTLTNKKTKTVTKTDKQRKKENCGWMHKYKTIYDPLNSKNDNTNIILTHWKQHQIALL